MGAALQNYQLFQQSLMASSMANSEYLQGIQQQTQQAAQSMTTATQDQQTMNSAENQVTQMEASEGIDDQKTGQSINDMHQAEQTSLFTSAQNNYMAQAQASEKGAQAMTKFASQ